MDINEGISKKMQSNLSSHNLRETESITKLKNIHEINNSVYFEFGDLVICSANESHVSEIAELWANHSSIQQLNAPERYIFKGEGKDWQAFVRRKIDKKNNLLLVAHRKGLKEILGFLYIQTITLPASELVLKGVIEDIYTKPQHRKLGIATKLMNVGFEWAVNEKIKQIDFVALRNIKGLSDFYSKFSQQSKSNLDLTLLTV